MQDWATQLRLQPALQHLACLVSTFEGSRCSISNECKAGFQWANLRSLVHHDRAKIPEEPASDRIPGAMGHRSTAGGIYEPCASVQSLPEVQRVEELYRLRCIGCGKELLSQWIYAFQGQTKVLTPLHGHNRCGRYESVVGMLCQKDIKEHLEVCVHGKKKRDCLLCGSVCKHKQIQRHCRHCYREGLIRLRPRQKN